MVVLLASIFAAELSVFFAADIDDDGIDNVIDNDGIPDALELIVTNKAFIDWDGVNDPNARSGNIINPKNGGLQKKLWVNKEEYSQNMEKDARGAEI